VNVSEVVLTVVGSLIAYIIATLLITALVTGTTAGDTLIQDIVPIVAAAGAVVLILKKFLGGA
jgi:hypothetical protein